LETAVKANRRNFISEEPPDSSVMEMLETCVVLEGPFDVQPAASRPRHQLLFAAAKRSFDPRSTAPIVTHHRRCRRMKKPRQVDAARRPKYFCSVLSPGTMLLSGANEFRIE
jgi:hypothetical protein